MFLSVFDIFKVGIGPSSSHTMGPMVAAGRFLETVRTGITIPGSGPPTAIKCSLHGSLAWTGKGHATDRAIILGLSGYAPDTVDPGKLDQIEALVRARRQLTPPNLPALHFDPDNDLTFDFDVVLPGHTNGMVFSAFDGNGQLRNRETYYSIGGGFVVTEEELSASANGSAVVAHLTRARSPIPLRHGAGNARHGRRRRGSRSRP